MATSNFSTASARPVFAPSVNSRASAGDSRAAAIASARTVFLRTPIRIGSVLLLIHAEHALGDEEAAEDIHAGQDQGEEAENLAGDVSVGGEVRTHSEQRAHHNH